MHLRKGERILIISIGDGESSGWIAGNEDRPFEAVEWGMRVCSYCGGREIKGREVEDS